MKLQFLAVGDLHIEALSTYLPDGDYLSPISQTLKQIWEYAKDSNITEVVLLGDIFDTPFPKDDAKKTFLSSLDRDINYHIILGNHDFATVNSNSLNLCHYFIEELGLMNNVKFYFQPTTVNINNVQLNFLPYPYKKPTVNAPAICFGHFETKGSLSDSGRVFKDGEVVDDKYTWILGHLHRRQGDTFPGSILQHRFGEPANKYFFHCKVQDDDSVIIDPIRIETPYKLLDIIVQKLEDLDSLEKENIYRIYISDHLDINEVTKKLKGFNIWQLKGVAKDSKVLELSESDLEFQQSDLADEISYLKKWLSNADNVTLEEEQIDDAIKIVEGIKNSVKVV